MALAKQTHRKAQKHTEHQDATYIQNSMCIVLSYYITNSSAALKFRLYL